MCTLATCNVESNVQVMYRVMSTRATGNGGLGSSVEKRRVISTVGVLVCGGEGLFFFI
jgi:hypothetical protein